MGGSRKALIGTIAREVYRGSLEHEFQPRPLLVGQLTRLGYAVAPCGILVLGRLDNTVLIVFKDEKEPHLTIEYIAPQLDEEAPSASTSAPNAMDTAMPPSPLGTVREQTPNSIISLGTLDELSRRDNDDSGHSNIFLPSLPEPITTSSARPESETVEEEEIRTPKGKSKDLSTEISLPVRENLPRGAKNDPHYAGQGTRAGEPSPNKKRKKAGTMVDCTCKMPESWKKWLVEEMITQVPFEKQLEVLHGIMWAGHDRDHPVPCDKHIELCCLLFHITYISDNITLFTRFGLIYDAIKDANSIRPAWVAAIIKNFFQSVKEIDKYKLNYGLAGKYKSASIMSKGISLSLDSKSLGDSLYYCEEGFLDWFLNEPIFMDILKKEVEMHLYHLPSEIDQKQGYLPNMYHSITMQMLRSDPFAYYRAVELRQDNNPMLISFPRPARYYPAGTKSNSAVYEGDTNHLGRIDTLCDEMVLQTKLCTDDLTFYTPRNSGAVQEFIRSKARGIDHYVFATAAERLTLNDYETSFGGERTVDSTTAGQLRVYKSGTIVKHNIDISHEDVARLAFSNSYVAITDGRLTKVNTTYLIIKEAYNNRTVPTCARFSFFNNKVFPFTVRLDSLSWVGDQVLCREFLSMPSITIAHNKFIAGDDSYRLKV